MDYSSLHKGYKCLHFPSNRVFISRDVVLDEYVYPFANLPVSHSPLVTESSLLSANQFMDIAYASSLLANHGAGTGCGAHLELLTPKAEPSGSGDDAYVDRPVLPPVMHGVYAFGRRAHAWCGSPGLRCRAHTRRLSSCSSTGC
jgi:hypothetical protein